MTREDEHLAGDWDWAPDDYDDTGKFKGEEERNNEQGTDRRDEVDGERAS